MLQLLSKLTPSSTQPSAEGKEKARLSATQAVAHVAYALSEGAFDNDVFTAFTSDGKKNVMDNPLVLRKDLETTLRLLRNTSHLPFTLILDDTQALEHLPALYSAVRNSAKLTVHLRRTYAPSTASLYDLGFVVLFSGEVQQAYDTSVFAHVISATLARPVLHSFDNHIGVVSDLENLLVEVWHRTIKDKNEDRKEKESETGKEKEEGKKQSTKNSGFYLHTTASRAIADEKEVLEVVERVGAIISEVTRREFHPFEYEGPEDARSVVVLFAGSGGGVDSLIEKLVKKRHAKTKKEKENKGQGNGVGVLKVRLYRPWASTAFLAALPSLTKVVAVLDFVAGNAEEGWGSLLLDVSNSVNEDVRIVSGKVLSNKTYAPSERWLSKGEVENILDRLDGSEGEQSDFVIEKTTETSSDVVRETKPTRVQDATTLRRAPYFDVLKQLFGNRLQVIEADLASSSGDTEFGYGVGLSLLQKQRTQATPKSSSVWLVGGRDLQSEKGLAAVHHVLSSGEKVRLLVIDDTPLKTLEGTSQEEAPQGSRRKDLGFYAMNYGGAYVASVALYSSYVQLLQALMEADEFEGPSLVLAYAPSVAVKNSGAALAMLKDTKVAVDNGSWPLYRWNPTLEKHGKEPFQLDSDTIKAQLKEFVDRGNQFSLLLAPVEPKQPIAPSVSEDIENRKQAIVSSFQKLVKALDAKPLLILYASDGGRAQDCARRIAAEGIRCGFNARYSALDDFVVSDLSQEPTVVFSVSTAGQGEFPTNGKEFWKSITETTDSTLFSNVKFAVLGLGDSHYWPGEDGEKYFCLPAIELQQKMEELGAQAILPVAKADDQHSDGHETVFASWKKELWLALGVGVDPSSFAESAPSKLPPDDVIKRESNYLRGTIAKSLADTSSGSVGEIDAKLLKFHGIYQQDDRDLRESRRKQNSEKAFIFMARVRLPGGVCTPAQWLVMDALADSHANGTLKLTTRQTFQMHGILKKNLKEAIAQVNRALMDTLAACGDVNRNVMCNPNPYQSELHGSVYDFAKRLSAHLSPHTNAYHEIWLDKQVVGGNAVVDVEPIYGPTYLPRKFKIAVAVPPSNDVDVFANDLGFIAIPDEEGHLAGFNITVGGGMGMTFNNNKTYPRTADILGFCKLEEAINVGEKILLVQRDHGDRTNRRHARLKYTIDDNGLEWFKGEVEARLGYKLEEPRPFRFTSNGDRYGWTPGVDRKSHFCVFIENGRVADRSSLRMRSALRELAKVHKGDFRLTPNQNIIIANVAAEDKNTISEILSRYGLDRSGQSGLRLNSMACVALPTCGLAFAESERYLPELVTRLEDALEEAGLRQEAITIRMSGCPNGCSRPYVAEIALVGRAPGFYNIYLGGGFYGQRLGKLYKESVDEDGIVAALSPLFKSYATDKLEEEHFGDYCIRTNIVKETKQGLDFHL